MEMENGEFQNVLYVSNLSSNLLSIYQVTHLGDGHRVEFLLDSIQVHSVKDNSLVAVRKVNDAKRLYSFSHFVPKSSSNALLHQSNSNIKLWYEWYGHLVFRYIQQFNQSRMVKGLPQINFSHNECSIDLVDIHLEGKLQGKSSREPIALQMVHMVLAGPFTKTSISQGCYILTFDAGACLRQEVLW